MTRHGLAVFANDAAWPARLIAFLFEAVHRKRPHLLLTGVRGRGHHERLIFSFCFHSCVLSYIGFCTQLDGLGIVSARHEEEWQYIQLLQ